MKKILLPLVTSMALFGASNSAKVMNDPFEQMDKVFQMQMQQMDQMQKQMDSMFKVFEQNNFSGSKMPVIFSGGGMMSSGIVDKKDHYEVALKIGKGKNTKVDVKAKNGILTISVEQSKEAAKTNGQYGNVKSFSRSSYVQSFTLPKDADGAKADYELKDDKIIVKIPKINKKWFKSTFFILNRI